MTITQALAMATSTFFVLTVQAHTDSAAPRKTTSKTFLSVIVRNTQELLAFCSQKQFEPDDGEKVERLKQLRYNIDYRNAKGETLLHRVVRTHRRDLLEYLIEQGVPVNVQDKDGRTALIRALKPDDGDSLAVGVLLDHGADPNLRNKAGETALHLAIFQMTDEAVNALLENPKTNVNVADNDGVTPLMLAAEYSDLGLIGRLLERGADRKAKDRSGRTAAQHASGSNMEAVREAFGP